MAFNGLSTRYTPEERLQIINRFIEEVTNTGFTAYLENPEINTTVFELEENKQNVFRMIDAEITKIKDMRPYDAELISMYATLRHAIEREFNDAIAELPRKSSMTGLHVRENAAELAKRAYKTESPLRLRAKLRAMMEARSGYNIRGRLRNFGSSLFGSTRKNTQQVSNEDDEKDWDEDVVGTHPIKGGKKSKRKRQKSIKRNTRKRGQNRKKRRTIRK
jgi:hypothetical protein